MGSSTQSWATGLPESYSSRWFITRETLIYQSQPSSLTQLRPL